MLYSVFFSFVIYALGFILFQLKVINIYFCFMRALYLCLGLLKVLYQVSPTFLLHVAIQYVLFVEKNLLKNF